MSAVGLPTGVRRVVIAGATGFMGRALASALLAADPALQVVGLTRSSRVPVTTEEPALGSVQWLQVDLFSLLECELALAGATHAIYLVHSMMPSARLTQASFDDLDLLLADNFARAAASQGIQQIVYLGGIIPDGELSPHLRSRREVEQALGSTGVPVVTVRAGLVLGPGGSSAQMMLHLVERLPVLACPRWTRSQCSPIDLRDLLPVLTGVLGRTGIPEIVDVGGIEVMSYRGLLERAAEVAGLRRIFLPIPWFSPGLSTLWVSLVSGSTRALVRPLVKSLLHSMVPSQDAWQREHHPPRHTTAQALATARDAPPAPSAGAHPAEPVRARLAAPRNTVRSVQRLTKPAALTAAGAADAYMRWLPRFFRPFFAVDGDERVARFRVRGLTAPLLVLERSADRSEESRPLFYVTGGMLARPDLSPTGRLEFRSVLGGRALLTAIHDFVPRLPWFVYNVTQAWVHLWVMHSFGRFLARREGRGDGR
jgi:uncharacterized protein YbjT (DUF2867 family)